MTGDNASASAAPTVSAAPAVSFPQAGCPEKPSDGGSVLSMSQGEVVVL